MYLQAAGHWEQALGLNPLFPQGWFALGYCCLKIKHQERALQVIAMAKVCTGVAPHSLLCSYQRSGPFAAVVHWSLFVVDYCLFAAHVKTFCSSDAMLQILDLIPSNRTRTCFSMLKSSCTFCGG